MILRILGDFLLDIPLGGLSVVWALYWLAGLSSGHSGLGYGLLGIISVVSTLSMGQAPMNLELT